MVTVFEKQYYYFSQKKRDDKKISSFYIGIRGTYHTNDKKLRTDDIKEQITLVLVLTRVDLPIVVVLYVSSYTSVFLTHFKLIAERMKYAAERLKIIVYPRIV